MNKSSGFIDFAAVKAAVSFEQILRHYGILDQLKPSGKDGLRGCCPIHGGTSPDQFCVSLAKNAWNCFSECQRGGNQLDFIMAMEKCKLSEAAWKANEWFNLGLEKQEKPRFRNEKPERRDGKRPAQTDHKQAAEKAKAPDKATATHPVAPCPAPLPEPPIAIEEETGSNKPLAFTLQNLDTAHFYPTERGLDAATIAEFGLGFCSKGTMAGRLVIPIHNGAGELVAYAGRWPGTPPADKEKYRFPGGFKKTLELYNAHRAFAGEGSSPLVIVEGFFGVMHLWQHGCRCVVALMGSHLSEAQQGLILAALSAKPRSIILALDNDEAGRKAKDQILPRLAPHTYIRAHRFESENDQPENMSPESVASLLA